MIFFPSCISPIPVWFSRYYDISSKETPEELLILCVVIGSGETGWLGCSVNLTQCGEFGFLLMANELKNAAAGMRFGYIYGILDFPTGPRKPGSHNADRTPDSACKGTGRGALKFWQCQSALTFPKGKMKGVLQTPSEELKQIRKLID